MAKSSLLTPDDHALLLIDHQYLQLLALRSHTSEVVVNNTTFLAKAAKLFKVPTLLTTAFAERQELFQEVQVFSRIRSRSTVAASTRGTIRGCSTGSRRPARRSW
jgi:nicotinamidase-related amidase